MINDKTELMNKLMEGVSNKGYVFARLSIDEIQIPFMNFEVRIRVTDYGKYMVCIFDESVLVEYRIYYRVGNALRYVKQYREQERQKEIKKILEG